METEWPFMKTLLEAAKRYRGWETEEIPTAYIHGWVHALIFAEATRIALEKVGFESLSGCALRDALAAFKNFDCGLMPPMNMSEEKPWYGCSMRMYEARGGRLYPIADSEWIEYPGYPGPWSG